MNVINLRINISKNFCDISFCDKKFLDISCVFDISCDKSFCDIVIL